jgi:hypothetical protein
MTLTVVSDTFPDTIRVSLGGLTSGQLVTVTRTPAGATDRTVVRGFDEYTTLTTALVRTDAEAPFGVTLTYTLTIDELDSVSASTTISVTGVVLSDAVSGDAAQAVILAWPDKRIERSVSVYPIGGRNIVVSGATGGFSSSIDLFTETDDSKNNVLNLLGNATSGIIQIRSDRSLTSDGVDCYVVPTSWAETRFSQDGSDERRVITMDVVESTPWANTLDSYVFDLGDIDLAYAGRTYADLAADYAGLTLADLAVGDFST